MGTVSEGLLPFLAPVLDLSTDLTQESHIYLLEVVYLFTSSGSIYRSYTGVPYISTRGSLSISSSRSIHRSYTGVPYISVTSLDAITSLVSII